MDEHSTAQGIVQSHRVFFDLSASSVPFHLVFTFILRYQEYSALFLTSKPKHNPTSSQRMRATYKMKLAQTDSEGAEKNTNIHI